MMRFVRFLSAFIGLCLLSSSLQAMNRAGLVTSFGVGYMQFGDSRATAISRIMEAGYELNRNVMIGLYIERMDIDANNLIPGLNMNTWAELRALSVRFKLAGWNAVGINAGRYDWPWGGGQSAKFADIFDQLILLKSEDDKFGYTLNAGLKYRFVPIRDLSSGLNNFSGIQTTLGMNLKF